MTEYIQADSSRSTTCNLILVVVPEGLDGGILLIAIEGNGHIFACGAEDATVDYIVTSRRTRHCGALLR